VGELMGMLNTHANTTIPARAGYEVVSAQAAGEVARWPVIAWAIVLAYGYGDGGGIIPVALGIVFDGDVHAVVMPDGRVLTTADGSPRWFEDAYVGERRQRNDSHARLV
jgi:hypothetical protein